MSASALHFLPGQKLLLWIVGEKAALRAEAWGGEQPLKGVNYGIMAPRQTTPGKYVVYSYAPYRTKTWPNSRILWGTPLKPETNGEVLYQPTRNGQWQRLTDQRGSAIPAKALTQWHFELYGEYRFPTSWVFNDFGPWAVRYFRDTNHNAKLDAGELLSGEMIHTTPENEAETATNQTVTMVASHGCIHVKPLDRDRFAKAGAFKPGNSFVVHGYNVLVPRAWR